METATAPPATVFDAQEIKEAFAAQQTFVRERGAPLYHERVKHLKRLDAWVRSHQEEIREALYADFKKPAIETDITEVVATIGEIDHALKNLRKWMRPKRVPTPLTMFGSRGEIVYEPKGVTLIIAPWNYPFLLQVGPLASALAAGNTAILKPSELTPHTAALISQMVDELFDPQEVVVFEGDKDVSQALLALPFDHIFFTGSPAVGKLVMRAASEHLTSVTLELGGKSPVVIDPTAHMGDIADRLMWGKYLNNGQTCIAPDYALVPENMVDGLVGQMKEVTKKRLDPEGKGIQHSGNYARIINERHYQRLVSALDEAVAAGAKVVMGGETDANDLYLSPTVVVDVPEDCALMQEEIFGPILPIKTYREVDEAIDYINTKPKPLALYYFGKQNERFKRLMARTSAGGVITNDVVLHFAHVELPFGGVNQSGLGKAHGEYGFLAFSNEKGTMHQRRRGFTIAQLTYPPYTDKLARLLKLLQKII